MSKTYRTAWPDGARITGRMRRLLSTQVSLLAALLLCTSLAGCTTSTASSSPGSSAAPSASETATASPTATPSPTAVPPLKFVATGSMHTARSNATATLLKNGKVLIAGGGNLADMYSQDIYASAELYDPATGTFTPTGSMTAARIDAAATLLRNGKVLIAGGGGCQDPKRCTGVAFGTGAAGAQYLASAELYDPDTGKFTKTGSMAEHRTGATATLLPDGRVLLYGAAEWAEIYNSDTGKFTRIDQRAGSASTNTATLLPNGKVLLTQTSAAGALLSDSDTGLLYDTTSGKFTTVSLALPPGTPSVQASGLTIPRTGPTAAVLLADGRVLLYEGGYLETYDPTSGACADAGFISSSGQWIVATATLLPGGRVLFEGGSLHNPPSYQSVNTHAAVLYDPAGGPLRTGSTVVARIYETTTHLPNGDVLIAGGANSDLTPLASAELFKP